MKRTDSSYKCIFLLCPFSDTNLKKFCSTFHRWLVTNYVGDMKLWIAFQHRAMLYVISTKVMDFKKMIHFLFPWLRVPGWHHISAPISTKMKWCQPLHHTNNESTVILVGVNYLVGALSYHDKGIGCLNPPMFQDGKTQFGLELVCLCICDLVTTCNSKYLKRSAF